MEQPLALRLNKQGFTLVEVIVSIVLVGMVLGMVSGLLFMLDDTIGDERLVTLPSSVTDSDLEDYGYSPIIGQTNPDPPAYALAPSAVMEAKADALWRQVQEIYLQSSAVGAVNGYLLNDFTEPKFLGSSGYLTSATESSLLISDLADPDAMHTILQNRFGGASNGNLYERWTPPSDIDANSYRAATVFFLSSQDRILGILRIRAFQFIANANDPYRYYEVNLSRLVWRDTNASSLEHWVLDTTRANFLEDFGYSFVEDKHYPQRTLIPWTSTVESTIEGSGTWPNTANNKNIFVRAAIPEETLAGNGISRAQSSFTSSGWDLTASINEWHVVLPDPGLAQGERRDKILRRTPRTHPNFNATLYNSITRQGRFACVFKVSQ